MYIRIHLLNACIYFDNFLFVWKDTFFWGHFLKIQSKSICHFLRALTLVKKKKKILQWSQNLICCKINGSTFIFENNHNVSHNFLQGQFKDLNTVSSTIRKLIINLNMLLNSLIVFLLKMLIASCLIYAQKMQMYYLLLQSIFA